jgi:hypothetical protein
VGSDYVWWLGNFCMPPCPRIFVILLQSSLWDAFLPCVRWWCWILSYDACELWISVNLDAGSNSYEFIHILAGSRMQPLMAAKSWLDPRCSQQAGSRLL